MSRRSTLQRFAATFGALAAGAVAALGGCATEPLEPTAAGAPFAVGGAIFVADAGQGRLLRVRVADGKPALDATPLPARALAQRPHPDGSQTLLRDTEGRALFLVRGSAAGAERWDLGVPFTNVDFCDDGLAAVAWHQRGAAATTVVNAAEVALVPLGTAPKAAARRAAAAGLAVAPERARCTAPLALTDGDHRLVWMEARSAIGLLDIGPTGATTVIVPLTPPSSNAAIIPTRSVARIQGDTVDLYLIAQGSSDVIRLQVKLGGAAPAVTLDQIGVGAGPVALELLEGADGVRALTLDATGRSVSVVNPATGTGTSVSLADAVAAWTVFSDGDGRRLAAAYAPGVAWVQLIDLAAVEKKKGKAVQRLRLEQAAAQVHAVGSRLLVRHVGVDGASMIDPITGKVSFFQGTGTIGAVVARGDQVVLLGTITSAQGVAQGRLSTLDLATGSGTSVDIGESASAMSLLPLGSDGVAASRAGIGGPWLALWPEGLGGKAHWIEGIAWRDVLTREVP